MTPAQPQLFILDDDSAHRRLIIRAFKKAGVVATFLEASCLQEARSMIFHETEPVSPDVFIIDLNLGDGRGTRFIEDLRQTDTFRQTPIVVLSTSTLESDQADCVRAGASRYIAKSASLNEFGSHVARCVLDLLSTTDQQGY